MVRAWRTGLGGLVSLLLLCPTEAFYIPGRFAWRGHCWWLNGTFTDAEVQRVVYSELQRQ